MEEDYKYDVFISYSTNDRPWVRDVLLQRLEAVGLTVCIDYRDFRLGVPIHNEIERGIEQSRKTLLVFTPNYLSSQWTELENLILQTDSPTNRQRHFLVLLKEQCELPRRLRPFIYANFATSSAEDLYSEWQRIYEFLEVQPVETFTESATQPTCFVPTRYLWIPVGLLITNLISIFTVFSIGVPWWFVLLFPILWSLLFAGFIMCYRQQIAEHRTHLQSLEQEHRERFHVLIEICEEELYHLEDKLHHMEEKLFQFGNTMVWIDASVRLIASRTHTVPVPDTKNLIRELLQEMLMLLASDIGFESKAASFLVLQEDGRFAVFAQVGHHRNIQAQLETEVFKRLTHDNSLAGYVLSTDKVVVVANLDKKPASLPWVSLSGDQRFPGRAMSPARLAGVALPIGVVCLDLTLPHELSEQDQQLMLIIASRVAYLWSLSA